MSPITASMMQMAIGFEGIVWKLKFEVEEIPIGLYDMGRFI